MGCARGTTSTLMVEAFPSPEGRRYCRVLEGGFRAHLISSQNGFFILCCVFSSPAGQSLRLRSLGKSIRMVQVMVWFIDVNDVRLLLRSLLLGFGFEGGRGFRA